MSILVETPAVARQDRAAAGRGAPAQETSASQSSLLPFALAIFLSAFLLFQVQLLLGKEILPIFGGAPAVWTVCILVFQLLYLAGYGYSHGQMCIRDRSCTARCHSKYEELKEMADGGARLFIVGFESGDPQILKNIKKGATTEMAREFMKNTKKVGIKVHGDFIIGLPGETKETIRRTIDFAKELDCETIQVSLAHAMPGTELHTTMSEQGFLRVEALADSGGHQLPHIEYPHLSKTEMMTGVNRFYDEYYFRPKVVWRIVKEALWDDHERKRLYHEATAFLKLRSERWKWARSGGDAAKTMISVPAPPSASGND